MGKSFWRAISEGRLGNKKELAPTAFLRVKPVFLSKKKKKKRRKREAETSIRKQGPTKKIKEHQMTKPKNNK